jgi:TolB-like protein/Tfp pilus assembly protein PilF
VAVLPFAAIGVSPDTEYFADGLTDELIDTLSRSDGLRVVARSSVYQFKGRTGDARGIGRALDAAALVQGSVRRDEGRIRVTAQLIDARSGSHVWSQAFDREWKQVFEIQREIAGAIAGRLRVRLGQGRTGPFTENIESYKLYLKGRYYWNRRTVAGFQTAIAAFREALDLDPGYAPAWAGLADSYSMLGFMNAVSPLEIRPKAEEAARRALQLDEGLATAHVALANVRAVYDWDWAGAEQGYRRAIALDPRSYAGHYGLSKLLASVGRLDDALVEIRRAQALDPLSMIVATSVAWELAVLRRYRESDDAYRAAAEIDPGFAWTHVLQSWSFEARGDYASAVASLRTAIARSAPSSLASGELAHALGKLGQRDEAALILSQLEEAAKTGYVSAFDLSRACEGLGRRDEAMAALARACDERTPLVLFLKSDPVFDPMRPDPRFAALLARMGLG